MTISNEAVERSARVLIEDGRYGVPWEDASEEERVETMSHAKEILEVAAPIILAGVLEDAAHAYLAENADVNQRTGTPVATQEQWRFYHWLSLRSAAERGRQ